MSYPRLHSTRLSACRTLGAAAFLPPILPLFLFCGFCLSAPCRSGGENIPLPDATEPPSPASLSNRRAEVVPSDPSQPVLHPRISALLSGANIPLRQRLDDLLFLRTARLTPDDHAALIRLVNDAAPYINLTPDDQDLFFNELLETLLVHPDRSAYLASYAKALGDCIDAPDRSVVVRDYAMQHLGSLLEAEPGLPETDANPLFRLLDQDDQPPKLLGTALRTLERLVQSGRLPATHPRVTAAANRYLSAPNPDGRHEFPSALHLAATAGLPAASTQARTLVRDSSRPPLHRMVAYHVLGRLGDASDLAWMKAHVEPEPMCTIAAAKARETLESSISKLSPRR